MKKITCMLLVMLMLLGTLTACMDKEPDPLALAKALDAEDYTVQMMVDDEQIGDVADELEIRAKGITCVLPACPNEGKDDDKIGIFIFCDSTDIAEDMIEDLEAFADKEEDLLDNIVRCIIERSGKMVFIGCEDAWEDAQ